MSASSITTDLCHALQQGKLCYVSGIQPNKQQSICAYTRDEMTVRGYRSIVLQFSRLSYWQQTEMRWDEYLMKELWYSFYPTNQARLSQWMATTNTLSPKERLIQFSNDLFLSELCEAPMTILINTIDTLVDVPFAISDIFTWIEHCYELRDTYLSYHHLSFAVFDQADLSKSDSQKVLHNHRKSGYLKSFYAAVLPSPNRFRQSCPLRFNMVPIS
ncbi:MAG: hypothetical protein AAFQ63_15790 [Cyanobacteria bacterium J06621_11]